MSLTSFQARNGGIFGRLGEGGGKRSEGQLCFFPIHTRSYTVPHGWRVYTNLGFRV
jgi:hypothetical protein